MMALCIGRAAVSQNTNFIELKSYTELKVPTPFQNRILMAYVIRGATHNHTFLRVYDAIFHKTVDTPENLVVILTDCVCLLLMLPVTLALRDRFHPPPLTSWFTPLLMLLVVAFTYVVRYEQRFTMPYDFLSLLLYNVGLLAILDRRGWLMLAVLALATPNRETVVFLIFVWFWLEWRAGRRISAIAYSVAGFAICMAWRVAIGRLIHSPHQPYFLPWDNNIKGILLPLHWPQLFSAFGYLAIPMWMLRGYITDRRLRDVWISTVPFIVGAMVVGVWRETRIFGELSALVAITFAIQVEQLLPSSASAEPAYNCSQTSRKS
jgi:hypothetical protein